MPRRFAPLKTAIWSDDDFRTLSPMGQRMYMQVLSQKRLSLCGVVPYAPRNWARGCADLSTADVEAHLVELVDRGYVFIDHDTEELLVRTMVKHDPPRGARSIAGMWNDWLEIDSAEIRQRVIHSIPDEIWHHETAEPPESAKSLRNAPCEGASDDRNLIENEQGASSFLLPPSSFHPPSSSIRASGNSAGTEADTPTPSTTTNEKDPRFETVIGLIVDADIAEFGTAKRANPERYRATCVNTLLTQRGPEIRQALAERPDATPEHVARLMRSPG